MRGKYLPAWKRVGGCIVRYDVYILRRMAHGGFENEKD